MHRLISAGFLVAMLLFGGRSEGYIVVGYLPARSRSNRLLNDDPAAEWPGLEGKAIFDFDPWAEAQSPRTSESAWLASRVVALCPDLARWVNPFRAGSDFDGRWLENATRGKKDLPPLDILFGETVR